MKLLERVKGSKYAWFVDGLPSIPRASALFHVKKATMTTPRRCRLLWNYCMDAFDRHVPGGLVECGVWRGGSSAIMALAARHAREIRHSHLFDSYQGLPEPGEVDEAAAAAYSGGRASGALRSIDRCKAELCEVERLFFDELHFDRDHIHFHAGWFQDTIPIKAKTLGPIAILRLDGDWYDSTKVCLHHLYPLLSPGGYLILDDYYAWAGCKKAADEFRTEHRIFSTLHRIDVDAAYWIKE